MTPRHTSFHLEIGRHFSPTEEEEKRERDSLPLFFFLSASIRRLSTGEIHETNFLLLLLLLFFSSLPLSGLGDFSL